MEGSQWRNARIQPSVRSLRLLCTEPPGGEQVGQQGGHLATRCEGGRTASYHWEGGGRTAPSIQLCEVRMEDSKRAKEVDRVRIHFAGRMARWFC